jgi:hypothetical protein
MKKRRRFQEGGDIPDIDREPLRDSSGEIVRDSSGEAIMSGSTPRKPLRQVMSEIDDRQGIDLSNIPKAETSPVRTSRIESKGDTDLAEPGTAGFSRTPLKASTQKVQTKPPPKVEVKTQAKAEVQAPPKKDVKAEIERLKAYDKPIERVTPELALVGSPLLKGLKTAGSGILSKLAPQAAKTRAEPSIPQEAAKALAMAPKRGGELATRGGELATRGGELANKSPKGELVTKGSDLVKRRESMAQLESPRRRLPFEKDMGKARLETQANKRRQLGGTSRSEDVIEMGMKRGGKVGSASSRGDGIAKRGKTRGRYI